MGIKENIIMISNTSYSNLYFFEVNNFKNFIFRNSIPAVQEVKDIIEYISYDLYKKAAF